jgi:hypothetical protein
MKIKQGLEDAFKKATTIPAEEVPGFGNAYCQCIIDFAIAWADLMEERIHNGAGKVSVASCADECSHIIDSKPGFGITGNQYAYAVGLLAEYWILGEPLRVWHNKQYDHEGKGVVNPAVLVVTCPNH